MGNLIELMNGVHLHEEYCADIKDKANEELARLLQTRSQLDTQMARISEDKRERVEAQKEEMKGSEDKSRNDEMEEQALQLMRSGETMELGKNLNDAALQSQAKPKAAPKKKPT